MKILLYTLNYAPELIGIGKYNTEMAEWLSTQGHKVRVVAANPYYPEWKIKDDYTPQSYVREKINGIPLVRCPIFVRKNISSALRLIHLFSFGASSFPVLLTEVKRWRPDVIMLIEPPLICAPGMLLICKVLRIKAWLHIQDFEIDAAFDTKLLSFPLLKRLLISAERLILNQFEVVSTISRKMVDQLLSKCATNPKIYKIQNWADTTKFIPAPPNQALKAELGISADDTIVLYSGNLGHKQGIETILDTAEVLIEKQHHHIQFILCGDGALRKKIEQRSARLQNVQLLPIQPIGRYKQLLNTADFHLIPQRLDINDNAMPSKLSTILSSGGVIIASANPDTELYKVVRDSGGVICMPEDANQLAESIISLSNKKKIDIKNMKLKAREYAIKQFEKNNILSSLNDKLRSLCAF